MGVEYFCDLCGKDIESGFTELIISLASNGYRDSSNSDDLMDCHVCNFCRDELLARKDKMLRLMSIMAGGGCDGRPSFDA